MIPKNNPVCDQCEKPIAADAESVHFKPLRGGLTLVVNNATGNAGKLINTTMDFCDGDCLADHLKAMRATISAKPPAT